MCSRSRLQVRPCKQKQIILSGRGYLNHQEQELNLALAPTLSLCLSHMKLVEAGLTPWFRGCAKNQEIPSLNAVLHSLCISPHSYL